MSNRAFSLRMRGGDYDGLQFAYTRPEAPPLCFLFRCGGRGCPGHCSPELTSNTPLKGVMVYKRVEVDEERAIAVYEPGEGAPTDDAELEAFAPGYTGTLLEEALAA